MHFLGVALQGFGSFRRDAAFLFPKDPGLYLLKGENRVQPRLGGNGAGKSTLWAGICWVLYGKTPRGLRAGSIANWNRSELTSGVVDFEQYGTMYSVQRSWDPNSLTIQEGEKGKRRVVAQDEVDKLVGATYDTFSHVALMSQFGQFFFDYTPTEKLAIFSGILNLEKWIGRSRGAAGELKDVVARLERSGLRQARLEGRIDTLRKNVKHYRRLDASATQDQKANSKQLTEDIAKLEQEIVELQAEDKELKAQRSKVFQAYEDAERRLHDVDKERRSFREALSANQARREGFVDSRKAVRAKINGLDDTFKSGCPYCFSKLTDKGRERIRKKLRHELDCVHAFIWKADNAIDSDRSRLQELELELTAVSGRMSKAKAEGDRLREQGNRATLQISRKTAELCDCEQALARVDEAGTVYREALRTALSGLNKCKAQLALSRNKSGVLEKTKKRLQFWVDGFKDVRLWIVRRALDELEATTNNALPMLGLDGWRVTFDVERETASGSVSKGFSVFIQGPDAAEPVPWEAWSGGETQRLRIAGAIGLADFIYARTDFKPSIEVWDEPTNYLSPEGIDDLLDFFSTRARKQRRQVWVVDHRALNAGQFDRVYTVVKDEAFGSYIEGFQSASFRGSKQLTAKRRAKTSR
jgi:DNA repair exonuclease SbcCD ATPase subunit